MKKTLLSALRLILAGSMTALCLFGCSAERYSVDYGGAKYLYDGAKDSYRAGQEVTLYFPYVLSDTDYTFYLDDEPLRYSYDQNKGFVITFTMPEHDVKLSVDSRNSMVFDGYDESTTWE